jgi:hypothetical protein
MEQRSLCDISSISGVISAPLAHVDVTEANGVKQTLLVDEVLDWLHEPQQGEFIHREGLATLLG